MALAILCGRPFLFFGREPGVAPPRIGSGRCVSNLSFFAHSVTFARDVEDAVPYGVRRRIVFQKKRGLVEPSENKHIDLNDGLGFAPRAPLPAPLLAFGLIIPYSVRFVNRPFRLTIKRTA